jgi:hypothetical protein
MYMCVCVYVYIYIYICISSLAAVHLIMAVIGLFLQDVASECRRVPTIVFYSGNFLLVFYASIGP